MKFYDGILTMAFPLVTATVKRSTLLQHDNPSSSYSLFSMAKNVFINCTASKQVDYEGLVSSPGSLLKNGREERAW